MTQDEILQINWKRLEAWAIDLAGAHATPCVLVGVGHDHAAGELHLCLPEDLPMPIAIGFLRKALANLEAVEEKKN